MNIPIDPVGTQGTQGLCHKRSRGSVFKVTVGQLTIKNLDPSKLFVCAYFCRCAVPLTFCSKHFHNIGFAIRRRVLSGIGQLILAFTNQWEINVQRALVEQLTIDFVFQLAGRFRVICHQLVDLTKDHSPHFLVLTAIVISHDRVRTLPVGTESVPVFALLVPDSHLIGVLSVPLLGFRCSERWVYLIDGGTVLVVVDQTVQRLFLGVAYLAHPRGDFVDLSLHLLVGYADTASLLVDNTV